METVSMHHPELDATISVHPDAVQVHELSGWKREENAQADTGTTGDTEPAAEKKKRS